MILPIRPYPKEDQSTPAKSVSNFIHIAKFKSVFSLSNFLLFWRQNCKSFHNFYLMNLFVNYIFILGPY